MESVWLALITAVVAPTILAVIQQWFKRQDKKQDWDRQDEVARQAKEAADKVAAKVEEVAVKADAVALDLKGTNDRVIGKLDVIHTLVNSNMTAAMQAEFDATTRELAMMHEVVELKKVQGHEPSVKTLAAIDSTNSRLSELGTALADRLKPQT